MVSQLSSPIAGGNARVHFENRVQASFVILMLADGYTPCFPNNRIIKLLPQAKQYGYDMDDLIVFTKNIINNLNQKLLIQIKHNSKLAITNDNNIFFEVIKAAWEDFNKSAIFDKNKDAFVLITGPLSKTDIFNTRYVLELARACKDYKKFYEKTKIDRAFSKQKREKLDVFKKQLIKANDGKYISDKVIYNFIKSFFILGYDLDVETGVDHALIHTLINQYTKENVKNIWSRIINEVTKSNEYASEITSDNIPEDIRKIFEKEKVIKVIPEEVHVSIQKNVLSSFPSNDLVTINLAGSWNEQNDHDKDAISDLIKKPYFEWINKVRDISKTDESKLIYVNGIWKIKERKTFFNEIAAKIYDNHLDDLKQFAISILGEVDPAFELEPDKRYAASIYGKELELSSQIRKGISESLALIGNNSEELNCTIGKAKGIVRNIINSILKDAKWEMWASLDRLLPNIAEADPKGFLSIIESELLKEKCVFDDLFSQESKGITGREYLSGLLWGLEALAWDENYFIQVCTILASLASRDPGGNYLNRPINSIITIILPWMPQTKATIDLRKKALGRIKEDHPDIAWKVIMQLLPEKHQISTGSNIPKWGKLVIDKNIRPSNEEYWVQTNYYISLAIEIASKDIEKLTDLVDNIDNPNSIYIDQLIMVLSSKCIQEHPSNEKYLLWEKLIMIVIRNRRYRKSGRSLDEEIIEKIEKVTEALIPENEILRYKILFDHSEYDLSKNEDDFDTLEKDVEKKRIEAVRDILGKGDLEFLLDFSRSVKYPSYIGIALAEIDKLIHENELLPNRLLSEDGPIDKIVCNYIWRRYYNKGEDWINSLDITKWTADQKNCFLLCLPSKKITWELVEDWLGSDENKYWNETNVNPYNIDEADFDYALKKLIENGRPHASVVVFSIQLRKYKEIDDKLCVRALLDGLNSKESTNIINSDAIVKLTAHLEKADVDSGDLFTIEWGYLEILTHYPRATPKFLADYLANNPEFYCLIIRTIYRSEFEKKPYSKVSKEQLKVISNAQNLLFHWKTPPGTNTDNKFNGDEFIKWVKDVEELSKESGHFDKAYYMLGKVLVYAPKDDDGLWINKKVAEFLNKRESKKAREGFETGKYNSRGVVQEAPDSLGEEDRKLAEQYRNKAKDLNSNGFERFAQTLRNLAETYERQAEQMGHTLDDLE